MAHERAKPELVVQFEALKQKAKEKGLPMFLGVPEHNRSTAEWIGGWSSFVDLAAQAGARVLYVEKVRFDSDDEESRNYSNFSQISKVRQQLERQQQLHLRPSERMRVESGVLAEDEDSLAPILAKLTHWDKHRGEVVALRCVWFVEAVAHEWQTSAKWLDEWRLAVHHAVVEAQQDAQLTRNAASEEDALRLHECARQMAQHERFGDAKSDAKRMFMVQQLFPSESEADRQRIVALAGLHYWWSVGPEEAASKEEKARQLHRRGESLSNIAAALDIPVAKVKRAVQAAAEE